MVTVAACGGGSHGGSGNLHFSRVAPDNGAVEGGEKVLVLGSNFASPASVVFGGVTATSSLVIDEHTISCRIPAHALGLVDVTVRAAGHTLTKMQGFNFINSHENEPANQKGLNDSFSGYQLVPLDADFAAHIGEQDDVDVFHIHTPFDGEVFFDFDWSASLSSGGLAGLSIEFFHGPDPTPNPDAYAGGSIAALSTSGHYTGWMRMSYVQDGHGPFLRIRGISDTTHPAGFDQVHPYIVHVHFVPDTSIEPGNAQDSFFQAAPITFTSGSAALTTTANYDQDYDWYSFTPTQDGWARVILDARGLDTDTSASAVQVGAKLFWHEPNNTTQLNSINGAEVLAGDLPTPEQAVFETPLLQANRTYYVRLVNQNDSTGGLAFPYDYHVIVQTGAGDFESTQPGTDLPAEVETSANLVSPSLGSPVTRIDYVFHEADKDWFKVVPGAGAVTVTVAWNHTAIRTALGDYDALHNPLGGQFAILAFDQTWFDAAGHTPSTTETVNGNSFDVTPTGGTHALTFPTVGANGSAAWYVLLSGVHGFDNQHSYSVTFTAN